MEQKTFSIEGMSCGHCEKAVTGALLEINGVEKAEANAAAGTADVSFDPALTNETAMKTAIEDQGYEVK